MSHSSSSSLCFSSISSWTNFLLSSSTFARISISSQKKVRTEERREGGGEGGRGRGREGGGKERGILTIELLSGIACFTGTLTGALDA